jgi:hypothetical protein
MNDCHRKAQNPGYRVIDFFGGNMKRVIEIRAAEGGDDSKLFAIDLAHAYQRHFDRVG